MSIVSFFRIQLSDSARLNPVKGFIDNLLETATTNYKLKSDKNKTKK